MLATMVMIETAKYDWIVLSLLSFRRVVASMSEQDIHLYLRGCETQSDPDISFGSRCN